MRAVYSVKPLAMPISSRIGRLLLLLALLPISAHAQDQAQAKDQARQLPSSPAEHRPWRAMVSAPLPCACLQGSLGYGLSEDVMVGVNYYRGAGFMFAMYFAEQYGVFARYKVLSSSFFVQLRLGQMNTMHEDGPSRIGEEPYARKTIRDYGPSWGGDIGNEWDLTDRLFHRFIWIGKDDYFKDSESLPLPHFLRYQFGIKF